MSLMNLVNINPAVLNRVTNPSLHPSRSFRSTKTTSGLPFECEASSSSSGEESVAESDGEKETREEEEKAAAAAAAADIAAQMRAAARQRWKRVRLAKRAIAMTRALHRSIKRRAVFVNMVNNKGDAIKAALRCEPESRTPVQQKVLRDVSRCFRFMSAIEPFLRESFGHTAKLVVADEGEKILSQGEAPACLLVLSGTVKIGRQGMLTSSKLEMGSLYGEHNLIDPGSREQPHDVTSASPICEVLYIDRASFEENFGKPSDRAYLRLSDFTGFFLEHAIRNDRTRNRCVDFLVSFAFFRQMRAPTRALFASRLVYKTLEPQEVVFGAGDPATTFYFILGGEVKLTLASSGGSGRSAASRATKYLARGDSISRSVVAQEDGEYTYTATATVNSKQRAQFLTMDYAAFESIFTLADPSNTLMLTPKASERVLRTDYRLRSDRDAHEATKYCRSVHAFKQLPSAVQHALCKSIRLERYPAGTVILPRPADPTPFFFGLAHGKCSTRGGDATQEAHYRTGDIFGHSGLQKVQGQPSTHSSGPDALAVQQTENEPAIVADQTCICLKFEYGEFRERVNNALASMLVMTPSHSLDALSVPGPARTCSDLDSIALFLKKLDFFKYYPGPSLLAVSKIVRTVVVPRGSIYVAEGDSQADVAVVIGGMLAVSSVDILAAATAEDEVPLLEAGDTIGFDFLDAASGGTFLAPKTLTAAEETRLCVFDLHEWNECITKNPVMQEFAQCRSILRQDFHLRSKKDILSVSEKLKHLHFLQQIPREVLLNACERFEYIEVPPATVIYSEGDLLKYFYVIVAGSVEIRKHTPEAVEDAAAAHSDGAALGRGGGGRRTLLSKLASDTSTRRLSAGATAMRTAQSKHRYLSLASAMGPLTMAVPAVREWRERQRCNQQAYKELTNLEVTAIFGPVTCNYCQGDAFGEKCAGSDGTRAETAIAFDAVTLLRLSSGGYDTVFKPSENRLLFQSSSVRRDIRQVFDPTKGLRQTAESCGATELVTKLMRPLVAFHGVPKLVLPKLAEQTTYRQYRAGETIVQCGSWVRNLIVLVKGEVQTWRGGQQQQQQQQPDTVGRVVAEGSTLGEIPFLTKAQCLFTIRACTDVEVVVFNRETYDEYFHSYSLLAARVAVIRKSSLYSRLSPGDVEALVSIGQFSRYPPKTDVTRATELGGAGVYLVVEGECRVNRPRSGVELEMGLVGPGEVFNEACILDAGASNTSSTFGTSGTTTTRGAADGLGCGQLTTTTAAVVLSLRGDEARKTFGRSFLDHVSRLVQLKAQWRQDHLDSVQNCVAELQRSGAVHTAALKSPHPIDGHRGRKATTMPPRGVPAISHSSIIKPSADLLASSPITSTQSPRRVLSASVGASVSQGIGAPSPLAKSKTSRKGRGAWDPTRTASSPRPRLAELGVGEAASRILVMEDILATEPQSVKMSRSGHAEKAGRRKLFRPEPPAARGSLRSPRILRQEHRDMSEAFRRTRTTRKEQRKELYERESLVPEIWCPQRRLRPNLR